MEAHDFNNDGWIVAVGDVDPGVPAEFHAILLTPVGECPADTDCTVDNADVLALLAAWGPCGDPPQPVPQSVQDCVDKFPNDPIALAACINAIGF